MFELLKLLVLAGVVLFGIFHLAKKAQPQSKETAEKTASKRKAENCDVEILPDLHEFDPLLDRNHAFHPFKN